MEMTLLIVKRCVKEIRERGKYFFCHTAGLNSRRTYPQPLISLAPNIPPAFHRSHNQGHPSPSPDGPQPKGGHGHYTPHPGRRGQHRAFGVAPGRHPFGGTCHEMGDSILRGDSGHI
ncbi:hypothetical protein BC939DRAFT_263039 [Gamsiella multidivaricata]|uniref:uncharacterized protein n=1 Tax=Gamsiella multidivaricata TaxID=101098 RepID=UPI0022206696|nr:uncharacterized protein BC939DRAFT_263039 [Gamsiella multidivaricata]KAI7819548.1 hypothetical protein BC939DRAFT_263039 [Gamsiella multidivaricata]